MLMALCLIPQGWMAHETMGPCDASISRSFWVSSLGAAECCQPSGGATLRQDGPWFPAYHAPNALSSTCLGEVPALLPTWSAR
jgi:hypothetical protein